MARTSLKDQCFKKCVGKGDCTCHRKMRHTWHICSYKDCACHDAPPRLEQKRKNGYVYFIDADDAVAAVGD